MIRPIQTATDGLIFARYPLSIAVRGLLARAVVIEESVSEYRGSGYYKKAIRPTTEELIRRDILREDEELLEMIMQAIISGVFD